MLAGFDIGEDNDELRAEDFFNVDEVISPDYLKEEKESFPEPIFLIESPDEIPRNGSDVSLENDSQPHILDKRSSARDLYDQNLSAQRLIESQTAK